MKIRRFYSHNVRSALKQVTDTFGDDAAILSNKKVEGGVEIIAALDYDESLMPPAEKASSDQAKSNQAGLNPADLDHSSLNHGKSNQSSLAQGFSDQSQVRTQTSRDKNSDFNQNIDSSSHFQSSQQSQIETPLSDLIQSNNPEASQYTSALAKLLKSNKTGVNKAGLSKTQTERTDSNNFESSSNKPNKLSLDSAQVKPDRAAPHSNFEWSMDPSLQAMRQELELMRSMMTEQLNGLGWERFGEKDPLAAMIIRRLTDLGLSKASVDSLLPFIDREKDAECCWQKVLAILAKSLPMSNDDLIEQGGRYAFVGPTGVGKTTSIAKLAARYVIKHGNHSIALISTDNQRISAQEQLATFGKILNVPTASVSKQASLADLLKKFAHKKLILIDTAGVSGLDAQESLSQLSSINSTQTKIKKILLMSATSQAAVLEQSIQIFQPLAPSALILTKLDEAVSLGELMSVVLKTQYPVMYTTEGQKIPEDIRLARSHHLVSKAVWLSNKYSSQKQEWQIAQSFAHAKTA